jgi:hypothetical protein
VSEVVGLNAALDLDCYTTEMGVEQMMARLLAEIRTDQEMPSRMEAKPDWHDPENESDYDHIHID